MATIVLSDDLSKTDIWEKTEHATNYISNASGTEGTQDAILDLCMAAISHSTPFGRSAELYVILPNNLTQDLTDVVRFSNFHYIHRAPVFWWFFAIRTSIVWNR
uniref:Macro domain-containing protein n=1 Tax=Heterorhabditis bacteriophora TaxID=37862 RepID=A0A1I7XNT6_HETBA